MPILASYMEGCVPIGILWREEGRGGDRGGRREGEGGGEVREGRGRGGERGKRRGEGREGREGAIYKYVCIINLQLHRHVLLSAV